MGNAPDERVACTRCEATFSPSLTRHACPVCGLAVPDAPPDRRLARLLADADNRLVALVVAATVANLALLLLLVVLVNRLGS